MELLPGLLVTPLRRIPTGRGDVLHALKRTDAGFSGFGEAYLSTVDTGARKGWKRHREMTMNLVVVAGTVRFTFFDDRGGEAGDAEITLSPEDPAAYARLTVPPGIWTMFEGVGEGLNMLLNLADRAHDPAEADNRDCATHAWPDAA